MLSLYLLPSLPPFGIDPLRIPDLEIDFAYYVISVATMSSLSDPPRIKHRDLSLVGRD